jgi:acetyltransferase-like isoleucine patch superfamily enzyme
MNVYGRIRVGNNVFIGVHTIILPGVSIGDNVVIGAGSVVNKDIPDNVVAAGVPAKIIKNIEEYKNSSLEKSCFLTKANKQERKNSIIENAENNRRFIN